MLTGTQAAVKYRSLHMTEVVGATQQAGIGNDAHLRKMGSFDKKRADRL
jgi:hypothetical protein